MSITNLRGHVDRIAHQIEERVLNLHGNHGMPVVDMSLIADAGNANWLDHLAPGASRNYQITRAAAVTMADQFPDDYPFDEARITEYQTEMEAGSFRESVLQFARHWVLPTQYIFIDGKHRVKALSQTPDGTGNIDVEAYVRRRGDLLLHKFHSDDDA